MQACVKRTLMATKQCMAEVIKCIACLWESCVPPQNCVGDDGMTGATDPSSDPILTAHNSCVNTCCSQHFLLCAFTELWGNSSTKGTTDPCSYPVLTAHKTCVTHTDNFVFLCVSTELRG